MKTALIAFRKVKKGFDGKPVERLINIFNAGGFSVDEILVLADTDLSGFVKKFDTLKDCVDNLIILDDQDSPISVKETVAENLGLNLIQNANAKKFVDAYNLNYGKNATPEYSLLPEDSTLIPNEKGAFQGYMIESDFLLTVLPNSQIEIANMCEKFVLPYFENKYGLKRSKLVFKMVGVSEKRLNAVIGQAQKISQGKITFDSENTYGDIKLSLIYDGDTLSVQVDQTAKFILTELKNNIYAEEDCSLSQRLVDMLKLYKVKFACAESFTGGRIASDIIKISGASEVFNEGIVAYSNDAKEERLFVKKNTLETFGAVSKETAYEMASGLLQNKDTDFVVATTGIAGPNSDGTDKPVGLAYIALGSREGIHIHKLNLSGDRETITETAKNKALHLAVKLLRQI